MNVRHTIRRLARPIARPDPAHRSTTRPSMVPRAVPAMTRVLPALALAVSAAAAPLAAQFAEGPPPPMALDEIDLPAGFQIEVYAEGLPAARQMALGDDGTLFVGSFGLLAGQPEIGNIYAVRDTDGDGTADETLTILEGLTWPNGVAFRDGALYVGERHRILRYDDIESRLDDPPEPAVVRDGFPEDQSHQWRYLEFGPDGKLYTPVGAPCNVCERDDPYASITRMNPDGSEFEIFARGVRNSVGLAFHPETGDLWFTENGRDMLGDDLPADELNRADRRGLHFGYPYCHQGNVPDPDLGFPGICADFRPPEVKLGPHVAALGLDFYTGTAFPEIYRGQLFVAEHGSWNRSAPLGYRIALVYMHDGVASGQEVFADGWLGADGEEWGRPVDVLQHPDGSLLVSDDRQGAIYRISYEGM